jgi:micrococcal nuclease
MKFILSCLFLFFINLSANALTITDICKPWDNSIQQWLYPVEVVSIYDGDTITANVNLGFDFIWTNKRIRLAGLNAPEVTGDTKATGLKVRDWLKTRLTGKNVYVVSIFDQTEKYGRYLGIIMVGESNKDGTLIMNTAVNINCELLRMGYATKME